ncbi:MAG: hypothetical protein MR606_05535 [Mollicutes bacterium]|nr:hypothetical protein [Mollicutes bacterium]MDD7263916.1 hypothetical protein [bacterium]MDY4979569.1 hypothetical protein [Candidatus Onthovivens sp.]
MIEFLKTFGKGLLYFVLLPFIVVFLLLYGLYLLVIFFITLFKILVLFFKGKTISLKNELDEKAFDILKNKKMNNVTNTAQQAQGNTINNTYNTIHLDVDPKKINNNNLVTEKDIIIDANDTKNIEVKNNE